MNYEPEHLKRWTLPDSYFGAEWPDWYVFLGQHRDSDLLTRVNFDEGLKLIGGESETVQVIRESHWAVGWVEWIGIHESDAKALQQADEIAAALADYPVVDEEAWSQREWDETHDWWGRMSVRERGELCAEEGVSIFAARRDDEIPEMVEDRIREQL